MRTRALCVCVPVPQIPPRSRSRPEEVLRDWFAPVLSEVSEMHRMHTLAVCVAMYAGNARSNPIAPRNTATHS